MINLSREFCQKAKEARRLAKLGQVEVANEVGCKQSALSAFENGDGTKLNDEVIRKLASKFNLEITTTDEAGTTPHFIRTEERGFCPNPHCPSNHGYTVDGRTLLRPNRSEADPVGGRYCAVCGEVLVKTCPNCGAPVHDGAICSFCGDPYIAI